MRLKSAFYFFKTPCFKILNSDREQCYCLPPGGVGKSAKTLSAGLHPARDRKRFRIAIDQVAWFVGVKRKVHFSSRIGMLQKVPVKMPAANNAETDRFTPPPLQDGVQAQYD